MNKHDIDVAGKYSAMLSMTEIGLGSLLHGWRIPFSGHFLSLNQGFISAKAVAASKEQAAFVAFRIAMIASLLKSLSPAGKRLTPMLAISVQGFLFTLGQYFFGSGVIGTSVSMVLLSLWGFIQPVIIYLLVFGKSIIDVGQYFFKKIQIILPITYDHLIYGVLLIVLIKLTLALVVSYIAVNKKELHSDAYFDKLLNNFKGLTPNKSSKPLPFNKKVMLVLKDLSRPWFVTSLIMMALFLYLSKPSLVEFFWLMLRPIAAGFIVFYALRFLPVEKWMKKLLGNTNSTTYKIFDRTMSYINRETE